MAGQKFTLFDLADQISLSLYERNERDYQKFGRMLNERYQEIGYKKPKAKEFPNVIKIWKGHVIKTQKRYNDGTETANDSRVISIQRRFDVTFCRERGSANAGRDNASLGATSRGGGNVGTVRGSRGGSSTFGGNNRDSNSSIFGRGVGSGGGGNFGSGEGGAFGSSRGNYDGGQGRRVGFRFHIRPELVLSEVSENDLNAALDEAEETAKKVQEGRAREAILEFYKKDTAKIWDLLLADTMQKSHDTTANEWTDVDRRVVRIAFTWSSYTTGWGKRAFEVPGSPSRSAMDQASSIHSNGDSSTGNLKHLQPKVSFTNLHHPLQYNQKVVIKES